VVKEVGAGVSSVRGPGDKVMAFTTYGAFAEEVKTDAARLLRSRTAWISRARPHSCSPTAPRTMHCANRGSLRAGETLLVLGAAGGVGLAAIEIGKALGARLIACASSDEKLAVCREHGADATINYAAEDLRERIKSLTGGQGVDVIYEPGRRGAYSEPAFRSIALAGTDAGGRLRRRRDPQAAAEPRAPQGRFGGGRCSGATFARREPKAFAGSIAQLGLWFREGSSARMSRKYIPLEKSGRRAEADGAREVKGKVVLAV